MGCGATSICDGILPDGRLVHLKTGCLLDLVEVDIRPRICPLARHSATTQLTPRPHTAILKGQEVFFLVTQLYFNSKHDPLHPYHHTIVETFEEQFHIWLGSFVGLSQNTLKTINVVSNERHLKMSIGSELGAKAGIGHGYAAAKFHRMPRFFPRSFQYFFSISAKIFSKKFTVFLQFLGKTWGMPISFILYR